MYKAIGDPKSRTLSMDDMLSSRPSWDFIRERYDMKGNDASYIDFFWTFRTTHVPLFQMMQAELPLARVYHTVTTGYAGFLACLAKHRLGVPVHRGQPC